MLEMQGIFLEECWQLIQGDAFSGTACDLYYVLFVSTCQFHSTMVELTPGILSAVVVLLLSAHMKIG